MKPTGKQVALAVARLGALAMFPTSEAAQDGIMRVLHGMVGTIDQLTWLVNAMLNHVGEWKGTAELRGVFCTRFKPADGIEATCSIPGFRAGDIESGHAADCLPLGSGVEQKLIAPPGISFADRAATAELRDSLASIGNPLAMNPKGNDYFLRFAKPR